MATLAELENALKNAKAANDTEAVNILTKVIGIASENPANQIPETEIPGTTKPKPAKGKATATEQAIGAGEAAITTVTAPIAGFAGQVAGTGAGLAEQILAGRYGTQDGARLVQQKAGEFAQGAMQPFLPSSEAGQQILQSISEAAAPLEALDPGMAMQMQAIQSAARAAQPAAQQAAMAATRQVGQMAAPVVRPVAGAASTATQAVKEALGFDGDAEARPSDMAQSLGAAEADMALQRLTTAESLPVPVKITYGQAVRTADELEFENEQMRQAFGGPLRQKAEESNLNLLQNFDMLIDETGAEAVRRGPSDTGNAVISALSEGWQSAKNKVNVAYKNAEKAGEMEDPVDTTTLTAYIDEAMPEAETAPLLKTVIGSGKRLGIFVEDENGRIVPSQKPVSLKAMEIFRKVINRNTDLEPTNQRQAGILKDIIDKSTEGMGGDLYKKARALRVEQANAFENRAVVARLLTNKKYMKDPQVAVDQVFNKVILNGSPDEISHIKKVLTENENIGENGKQAWKELQGATYDYIRKQSETTQTDSMGNPILSQAAMSRAVDKLDSNGRLDIIFGPARAQTVRDINDVLKWIQTVPPGTLVNTSGSGSLAIKFMTAMAEAGTTGALTGVPLPVLSLMKAFSEQRKNLKLQRKIDAALRASERIRPED